MKKVMKTAVAAVLSLGLLSSLALTSAAAQTVIGSPEAKLSASVRSEDNIFDNFPLPLVGYGRNKVNQVYDRPMQDTVGYIGYFDDQDPVTIVEVDPTSTYVKVSYTTSSGVPKSGWSQFTNFSTTVFYGIAWVGVNTTVYTSSNLSKSYGYVTPGEPFYVLQRTANADQIIYALDGGGYKLAWVPSGNILTIDIGLFGGSKLYPISTGRTTTYTAPGTPGYAESGWFDGNDEIVLNEAYTNGWAKVTYPLSAGGTKTAFCRTSDIIKGNITRRVGRVTQNTNVYRRPGGEYYGYVDNTESFTIIGVSGSYYQIMYRLSAGGYKIAWISASAVV